MHSQAAAALQQRPRRRLLGVARRIRPHKVLAALIHTHRQLPMGLGQMHQQHPKGATSTRSMRSQAAAQLLQGQTLLLVMPTLRALAAQVHPARSRAQLQPLSKLLQRRTHQGLRHCSIAGLPWQSQILQLEARCRRLLQQKRRRSGKGLVWASR